MSQTVIQMTFVQVSVVYGLEIPALSKRKEAKTELATLKMLRFSRLTGLADQRNS